MGNTHSSTFDAPPPYSELPPAKRISKLSKLKISVKHFWKRISNEETWKRIGKRVLKALVCIGKIIGNILLVVVAIAAFVGCVFLLRKLEEGSPNPGVATGFLTSFIFNSVFEWMKKEKSRESECRCGEEEGEKAEDEEKSKKYRCE